MSQEEKKEGCCGSSKSCCGPNKLFIGLILAALLVTLGYFIAKKQNNPTPALVVEQIQK